VTEAEWLAHRDPDPMLAFLRDRASDRKLRLFACACYRRLWLFLAPRSRQFVEASEGYVAGLVSPDAWRATCERLQQGREELPTHSAAYLSPVTVGPLVSGGAWAVALNAVSDILHGLRRSQKMEESNREVVAQADLLREVVGNPFRRRTVNASWLAAHDGAPARIARTAYENRNFADLPILADALEDAGCSDRALLNHLRGPGPHVLGCWALDLVLGRE
jgi:hypothetical protein